MRKDSQMSRLNPCPDCGDQDKFQNIPMMRLRGDEVFVECFNPSCPVQPKTKPCMNFEEAEQAWNNGETV